MSGTQQVIGKIGTYGFKRYKEKYGNGLNMRSFNDWSAQVRFSLHLS